MRYACGSLQSYPLIEQCYNLFISPTSNAFKYFAENGVLITGMLGKLMKRIDFVNLSMSGLWNSIFPIQFPLSSSNPISNIDE